jgi:hypothetical protein
MPLPPQASTPSARAARRRLPPSASPSAAPTQSPFTTATCAPPPLPPLPTAHVMHPHRPLPPQRHLHRARSRIRPLHPPGVCRRTPLPLHSPHAPASLPLTAHEATPCHPSTLSVSHCRRRTRTIHSLRIRLFFSCSSPRLVTRVRRRHALLARRQQSRLSSDLHSRVAGDTLAFMFASENQL